MSGSNLCQKHIVKGHRDPNFGSSDSQVSILPFQMSNRMKAPEDDDVHPRGTSEAATMPEPTSDHLGFGGRFKRFRVKEERMDDYIEKAEKIVFRANVTVSERVKKLKVR